MKERKKKRVEARKGGGKKIVNTTLFIVLKIQL